MKRFVRTSFAVWFLRALIVALFVSLLPAVAGAAQCADVRCGDLDASGSVVASDALRLLHNVIGLDREMVCPAACGVSTSTTSSTTTTFTTTSTMNTTTTMQPASCAITFRLTDSEDWFWWLQFDVDYSRTGGEVLECASLISPQGLAIYRLQSEKYPEDSRLAAVLAPYITTIEWRPFPGPQDVMRCDYAGPDPVRDQFDVIFIDGGPSFGNQPDMEAGSGVCGSPVTGLPRPTYRDYLWVIWLGDCPPCECDVNHDGAIDFSDGFAIYDVVLGQPSDLSCSRCQYGPDVRGAADPLSVVVSDIDCTQ